MKRMMAILLAILVLTTCPMAYATEETELGSPDIDLFYEHTDRIFVQLTINSSGNASCYGDIRGLVNSNKSTLTVTLSQYDGGWIKLASWSASGGGTSLVTASGTKKIDKGYKYRLVSSGTIRDASGKVIERPSKTQQVSFY